MKKRGILNKPLSDAIAGIGHTDRLVICDAGFPVPASANRIDLALKEGMTPFMEVFKAVLEDMAVEKLIIARETKEVSPARFEEIAAALPKGVEIEFLPHIDFKRECLPAKAVVRTGEFTPYSNVCLVAGVVY